ncbi:Rho guanine nucleotide exchange factor [Marasmius crinis-equi]|uniref:Rho guanine nucleotide exchange factor n=1 Tax=Marasmius crinis-equi TaxID=585013 RepID=A0ABR3F703_9AGAR
MQQVVDRPNISSSFRSSIFATMLRLSKRSGLHPTCLAINNVRKIGDFAIAAGGFGDVWKGVVGNSREPVCLKVMKVYLNSDLERLSKEYIREAILWRQLKHPNLIPCLGIYRLEHTQQLCLISPWMENGNLVQFLKASAQEDVDHYTLACDIAAGLSYLHLMKVVHGDLKGPNILITTLFRAVITDFGLSRIADSHGLKILTSTSRPGGTARWLAPELLIGNGGTSKASDVYAYACVCYEIFTGGCHPFLELPNEMAVVFHVAQGKRPVRPQNTPKLENEMWALMELCWDGVPASRPTANQLLARISTIDTSNLAFSPAPDWDESVFSQIWANVEYPPLATESLPATRLQVIGKRLVPSRYAPAEGHGVITNGKAQNLYEHPERTTSRNVPRVQEAGSGDSDNKLPPLSALPTLNNLHTLGSLPTPLEGSNELSPDPTAPSRHSPQNSALNPAQDPFIPSNPPPQPSLPINVEEVHDRFRQEDEVNAFEVRYPIHTSLITNGWNPGKGIPVQDERLAEYPGQDPNFEEGYGYRANGDWQDKGSGRGRGGFRGRGFGYTGFTPPLRESYEAPVNGITRSGPPGYQHGRTGSYVPPLEMPRYYPPPSPPPQHSHSDLHSMNTSPIHPNLTPPHPWATPLTPLANIPVMLDEVRYRLLGQLEYYFSGENMSKDVWLRKKMSPHGWILLSVIATFNRIRQLTDNLHLLREVLGYSEYVEVSDDGEQVRMRDGGWKSFVLDEVRYRLLSQLEYYLSGENMAKDVWLRSQMSPDGWILLSVIATFNRIRQLTDNLHLLREVLGYSEHIEVSDDGEQLKAPLLPPVNGDAANETGSSPPHVNGDVNTLSAAKSELTPTPTGASHPDRESDGDESEVEEDLDSEDEDDVVFVLGSESGGGWSRAASGEREI